MNEVIKMGELEVAVTRSPRRRAVRLTVDRFGEVVVAAPKDWSIAAIETVVQRKRLWIHRHLVGKGRALQPIVSREFVSGEGFFYLGHSFRLKLTDSLAYGLELREGRFLLPRSRTVEGRKLFIEWYRERAKEWVPHVIQVQSERVGAKPRRLIIRDLGYRWGSCSKAGDLYIHWRIMLLPQAAAEYVIVHELTHLRERHHGPAFYALLRAVSPDHEAVESWLHMNAAGYTI